MAFSSEGGELTCVCSCGASLLCQPHRRLPHPPPPAPPFPTHASQRHSRLTPVHPCSIDDLPDNVLEHVFVLAGQRFQ